MTMTIEPDGDALGVLDIQPTFMPGGSLPAFDGEGVITPINRLLRLPFGLRFAAQDWHPPGHVSFVSSHRGYEPTQTIQRDFGPLTLWPDHAVQGTAEANLHSQLDTTLIDVVIRKGTRPNGDGLSAFSDCGHKIRSGLASMLRERGIRRVFLVGLVLDVGVAASAEDAAQEGFTTFVVEDACRPSKPDLVAEVRRTLERANVTLVRERDLR